MTISSRRLAAAVASLVALGVLSAPAATAHPTAAHSARVAAKFTVTLKANNPKPVAGGTPLVLSGKVKPAKKGTVVVLQKQVPGGTKWVRQAKVKTSSTGAFTYRYQPTLAGAHHYRAVVPTKGKTKQGISKPVTVTVYAWRTLGGDIAARTHTNTSLNWGDGGSINGHQFAWAYVGDPATSSGSADWNVGRQCTRLRALFGLSDNSDNGAAGTLSVLADGVSKYQKAFTLGQSEDKTVDITGAFRIAYSWTSSAAGTTTALAEPQVLCSF